MNGPAGDDALAMSFGEVADAYDRFRPSYPPEAVDWVAEQVYGRRAAEMGAGTGIATELFVVLGFDVVAVEPDFAMAEIGARRVPEAAWKVVSAEEWDREGAPFDLIYGAQSWHWIPTSADRRIAEALRSGGAMMWMWNHPQADDRARLFEGIYEDFFPDIENTRRGRLHRRDRDYWTGRLGEVTDDVDVFEWKWTRTMTTGDYVSLTGTYSDHLALPSDRRQALQAALASRIDEAGGRLELHYLTRVYLGRTS